jgi:hypothetical protein
MASPPGQANAIVHADANAQKAEDRDVAIGIAPTPAEPTIAFVAKRSRSIGAGGLLDVANWIVSFGL